MKLGLLGDIHAEDERLAAALRVFKEHTTDAVLFVGDLADGLGDLDRCCALLEDARALGVRGNHDRWLIGDTMRTPSNSHHRSELAFRSVKFLESLPAVRDVVTPLGTLLLCHGVGEDDMCRLRPDDEGYALETNDELQKLVLAGRYALAVGGHTHERMVRRFGKLTFINAGTLARDHTPCCAVLDCVKRTVDFIELDDPAAPLPSDVIAF